MSHMQGFKHFLSGLRKGLLAFLSCQLLLGCIHVRPANAETEAGSVTSVVHDLAQVDLLT